jgi:hypothetical protein
MEPGVLNSNTPLAFEIVANDQNGMRVELQTIGEAARFISNELIGELAEAVDWKHAAAALKSASSDPNLVKHATEAVQNLLEAEGMLSD